MENTYWNSQGKYQEFVERTDELTPNYGDTDNEYTNLFLAISNLYYDAYNNGGCNIVDCYSKEVKLVKKYLKQFNVQRFIKDEEYREKKTDEVFALLQDKDLSCTLYKAYYSSEGISSHPHPQCPEVITFGSVEMKENWLRHRGAWDKVWG